MLSSVPDDRIKIQDVTEVCNRDAVKVNKVKGQRPRA